MKLGYKLIFVLLVGSLVLPFVLPGPDGRPVMNWRETIDPAAWRSSLDKGLRQARHWWGVAGEAIPDFSSDGTFGESGDLYYRWQDSEGVWHFSDKAPEGVAVEQLRLPEVANPVESLAPAVKAVKQSASRAQGAKQTPTQTGKIALPLPGTVSLEQIPDLIENAQGVQEVIDQRNRALEQNQ